MRKHSNKMAIKNQRQRKGGVVNTKKRPYKSSKIVNYAHDDHIYSVHEHNLDKEAREIFLFGENTYAVGAAGEGEAEPGVEYVMASRFIKNLRIIMNENPSTTPILIHMKTNGGDWHEGMAIYNMIKACPNPVTILNYTHARSMSSLIFLAADKRVMMPDATFMFHYGSMAMAGTAKQYLTEAEELVKTNERMLNIYIDAMKEQGCMKSKNRATLRQWLIDKMDKKEEVYLNAQQAIKYGFADEVFGMDGSYDWDSLTEYTEKQLAR